MKIDPAIYRLYFDLTANKKGNVTKNELANIYNPFRKKALEETFKKQQSMNEKNGFDPHKETMTLSEYLSAVNLVHKKSIFSQKNINLSDKEYVLKHLDELADNDCLGDVDDILKKDPEFILEAMKIDPRFLKFADKSIKTDPHFMLQAIGFDGYSIKRADKSLLTESFIIEAIATNWMVLEVPFVQKMMKESAPDSVLNQYYLKTVEPALNELKKLGIQKATRLKNIAIATEVIENRKKTDARPIALIVFPNQDPHDDYGMYQVEELIKHGYRVVYYEASNEQDFYNAIINTGENKIDFMLIGGHGRQTLTVFGKKVIDPNTKIADEKAILDLSDEADMEQMNLKRSFKKNAVIAFLSCETGKPGTNLVKMAAKVFSNQTVFAPTGLATMGTQFRWGRDNHVVGIDYKSSSAVKIEPKK